MPVYEVHEPAIPERHTPTSRRLAFPPHEQVNLDPHGRVLPNSLPSTALLLGAVLALPLELLRRQEPIGVLELLLYGFFVEGHQKNQLIAGRQEPLVPPSRE